MDTYLLAASLAVLVTAGGFIGNWAAGRIVSSAQAHSPSRHLTGPIEVGLGSNAKPAPEAELKLSDVA